MTLVIISIIICFLTCASWVATARYNNPEK